MILNHKDAIEFLLTAVRAGSKDCIFSTCTDCSPRTCCRILRQKDGFALATVVQSKSDREDALAYEDALAFIEE